ncbi:MAG: outer membrane protein assembly factor BamE [Pseudomonadota bacterium]
MPRTSISRRLAASAIAALALLNAGCSSLQGDRLFGAITPYRIDVMQGNVITKELAANVKPGMTRDQVRDLLGSPLLTSAFHAERWDYVFTMRRQGVEPQRRSVVAFFKGDVLERLEAPELPSERDFVGSLRPARSSGSSEPVLALTDEQRKALPPPLKGESTAAAQPLGANRPYPPLEPQ